MLQVTVPLKGKKDQEEYLVGCMVCGEELIYDDSAKPHRCNYCGEVEQSTMHCSAGHFVCDQCHRSDALGVIEVMANNNQSTNPLDLAYEIMRHPSVHMHGPEHHGLVPAVLLATVRNLGIEVDPGSIQEATSRATQLPGGICGSWGACGTGLGAGIALSVLRKLTPLSKDNWGKTNQDAGEILQRVGEYGGPRCCKRSTYSAILAAVKILERDGLVKFPEEAHKSPVCQDFNRNEQCLQENCPYYP